MTRYYVDAAGRFWVSMPGGVRELTPGLDSSGRVRQTERVHTLDYAVARHNLKELS